jgi:hypothetical protein
MINVSIVFGFLAGLIHGLFFFLQRRRVLSVPFKKSHVVGQSALFTLARLVLFAVFLGFLLRYTEINLILFMVSFFGAFWLIILNTKAQPYGRL